uniref:Neuroblast differentiation-associated protein AHNAK-like n=1 Tax=Petromyzon marinus TaxID=7757 RepID=A0AAJ7X485_PETMA|nr:neuroblast differentiation-associated protein AHNAK-like [Petromyzon marinus]
MAEGGDGSESVVEILLEGDEGVSSRDFSIDGGGKRGIYIKELDKESPLAKKVRLAEGDQIISATVYFKDMKYEDAVRFLSLSEHYTTGLRLRRTSGTTSPAGSPTGTLEHPSRKAAGGFSLEGGSLGGVGIGGGTATTVEYSLHGASHPRHLEFGGAESTSPTARDFNFGSMSPTGGSANNDQYTKIFEKKIKPRLSFEDLDASGGPTGGSAFEHGISTSHKGASTHATTVLFKGQRGSRTSGEFDPNMEHAFQSGISSSSYSFSSDGGRVYPDFKIKQEAENGDRSIKLSGPTIKGPDAGFSFTSKTLNISGPSVQTDASGLRETDAHGKGVDFSLPGFDTRSLGGKVSGTKITTTEVRDSSFQISGADLNLNVKKPKVTGGIEIADSKLDAKTKSAQVDVNAPGVEIPGNLNITKIKIPKYEVSFQKMKGSGADAGTSAAFEGTVKGT